MKRCLIVASCLALFLPGVSFGQASAGPPNRPPVTTKPAPGYPNRPGRPGGGDRPGTGPNRPGTGPNRPGGPNRPPSGGHRPRPPGDNRPRPPSGHRPPGHHRPPPSNHRPHRPGYHRPGGSFCYLGRCRPGFHGGRYRYPAGFAYRRWSNGQTLPRVFLSAAYFFTSYAAIGLDAPPYGYQWVRYGPDLLLVNLATGRIVDVAPGAVY